MDWSSIISAFIGAFAGVIVTLLVAARLFKQPDIMSVSRETLDAVEDAKVKYGLPDWDADEPESDDTDLSDLSIDPEDRED